MSQTKQLLLYNGKLSAVVSSATNTISGSIGCVGTCSTPAKIPTNTCNVNGSSLVIYDEKIATGWSSWSWGPAANATFNYTGNCACGSRCVSTVFNSASSLSFHNDKAVAIDTTLYTHFEFFIRATATIDIRFYINNGPNYVVQSSDIVNYAMEDTWTRVRIDLSKVSITGAISRIDIASQWYDPLCTAWFDNVRFVTKSAVDTLVSPVSGAAAPYKAPVNSCAPAGGDNNNSGYQPTDEMSSSSSLVAAFAMIVFSVFASLF